VTDPAATATSGSSGGRGGAPEGIGLRAAAGLLAASALLSRILGYVRDAVLANQVGAGAEADAYFAAFMVPDILSPQSFLLGFGTGANGSIDLATLWPVGLPMGVEIYAQYWIEDAGAVFGYAASNAITATTP
jgi:hypothetical protein